ncbi:MAG: RNA-binding S4 domain-containing protein [Anaerovoracaceae bacterium]|nr:RNA-binding S4 domain-containing protein [Anaerovoracaceae bacterium]
MRIDKFLKNSRLIKRRTIAKEACDSGKVTLNDRLAKAGTEVKVGDIIKLEFGRGTLVIRVLILSESSKKEDAPSMYEIIEG